MTHIFSLLTVCGDVGDLRCPIAKVIHRQDLGLMSHPKDWRSPGTHDPWFTRRVDTPLLLPESENVHLKIAKTSFFH